MVFFNSAISRQERFLPLPSTHPQLSLGIRTKSSASHKGYYWVYQNSIDKIVLFDYQEGRGREGSARMLKHFEGYLQTDGYQIYDHFDGRKDLLQIHCMAHARRYFTEAVKNDKAIAEYALGEIQKHHAIERKCKEEGLLPDEIKTRRQEQLRSTRSIICCRTTIQMKKAEMNDYRLLNRCAVIVTPKAPFWDRVKKSGDTIL